jgi:glycosyltransferase involved in cell wall biosynthesis
MKVLFNCHMPYMLAHGGLQIQIDQTMGALRKMGVEVEPLRWWDEQQTGDVLHHFGRIPFDLIELGRKKGMKVVFSDFLGNVAARPAWRIAVQQMAVRTLQPLLPPSRVAGLNWESYRQADACIALTPAEAELMTNIFGAPAERVHVVMNGVEDVFFHGGPSKRGEWLVCTATIRDIKRTVELALGAVEAQTPVWIIGKPYAESEPYAQQFFGVVREHPKFVRYEGAIENREALARVYREARGFVLISAYESLSLSALEAAACECPLLLSDLPWARTVFKEHVSYCPIVGTSETARVLRRFYEAAPNLKAPPRPLTWIQVGEQLVGIYKGL